MHPNSLQKGYTSSLLPSGKQGAYIVLCKSKAKSRVSFNLSWVAVMAKPQIFPTKMLSHSTVFYNFFQVLRYFKL